MKQLKLILLISILQIVYARDYNDQDQRFPEALKKQIEACEYMEKTPQGLYLLHGNPSGKRPLQYIGIFEYCHDIDQALADTQDPLHDLCYAKWIKEGTEEGDSFHPLIFHNESGKFYYAKIIDEFRTQSQEIIGEFRTKSQEISKSTYDRLLETYEYDKWIYYTISPDGHICPPKFLSDDLEANPSIWFNQKWRSINYISSRGQIIPVPIHRSVFDLLYDKYREIRSDVSITMTSEREVNIYNVRFIADLMQFYPQVEIDTNARTIVMIDVANNKTTLRLDESMFSVIVRFYLICANISSVALSEQDAQGANYHTFLIGHDIKQKFTVLGYIDPQLLRVDRK